MFKFQDAEVFHVKGRGDVYTVRSPVSFKRDSQEWKNALGDIVEINGKLFKAIGLETFCLGGPITIGERIGILVEEIEV